MRISEQFFTDSIQIGSLRLPKGYLMPLPADARNGKRASDGTVVLKAKAPVAKKPKVLGAPKVDQYCHVGEGAKVVFADGVFWSATLNQSDIVSNANKFYIIQLLELQDGSITLFNRWGRQGYTGVSKNFDGLTLGQAKGDFCSKFSTKTKNRWYDGMAGFVAVPGKYTWLDMDFAAGDDDDDDEEEVHTKPAKKTAGGSLAANRPLTAEVKPKTSLTVAKPAGSTVGCKLDPRLADLVQMIFDNSMMQKTVAAMNFDVKKQPLGKLSKLTIKKALGVLKEVEELLSSGKASQTKISDCSNRFYTLIPHSSGKMRLPFLDNLNIIQDKLNLLDTLNEIDAAAKLKKEDDTSGDSHVHPLDRQYSQLNLELAPLDKSSDVYATLSKWVAQTHASTHTDYKLKILDIFEVDRPKDQAHFVPYEGLHNQQLLWHGSRMSNWVGILSQGLRIAPPEAPVTGYMFGKGVYFADIVSKSANYCATNKNDNVGFLMACQVALGDMYDRTAAEFVKKLDPRYQSCRGVGLSQPDPNEAATLPDGVEVPLGKIVANPDIDHSDLLYNEFIVYDIAQIKFRYFFKFQFMYK